MPLLEPLGCFLSPKRDPVSVFWGDSRAEEVSFCWTHIWSADKIGFCARAGFMVCLLVESVSLLGCTLHSLIISELFHTHMTPIPAVKLLPSNNRLDIHSITCRVTTWALQNKTGTFSSFSSFLKWFCSETLSWNRAKNAALSKMVGGGGTTVG